MSDNDPDVQHNPHRLGSTEYAEWSTIAAAPSWHSRPAPERKLHLAWLAERRDDQIQDGPGVSRLAALEDHRDMLTGLASVGVIFGPDVSQFQDHPNWATVRTSGCKIKIWKETEGRTYADPSAPYNRTATTGMVEGSYHYLYFSQEYVDKPALWAAQADWYAKNTRKDVGHLLDVEAAATLGHHLGVREWVAEYRKLFPTHPLGCYTNRSLWTNRSRIPYPLDDLFDYVWHAGIADGRYTPATGSIGQEWAATGTLTNSVADMGHPVVELWQISDHAQLPGVVGGVDGNAYLGSAAELTGLFLGVKAPVKPEAPALVHPAFPLPLPGRRETFYGPGGIQRGGGFTTWQRRMRNRGWPITADGVYGPQSARIARLFQTEKRLKVDGLVGRKTWDAAWTAAVT